MKKVMALAVFAMIAAIGQAGLAQEADRSEQDRPQRTHEQLRIAVQKICPVTGGKLGSMGDPVKGKIGQEDVFLCCDGCDTDKASKKHVATIHANIAKAQAKCPVMNKALPKNPKAVIVDGQPIYICCPGCEKKIKADPQTYVKKVDALYAESLKADESAK